MLKHRFGLQSRKDVWKLIRSIIEAVILAILLYMIIQALFVQSTYEPYDSAAAAATDNGFIVVSYYGAERKGDNLSLSVERLEEQLEALYDSGYVTITQQDVMDYYSGKRFLPPKSLFLIFEDGERGTAIFAEKIMEKYNFKATMLTYSDYFFNPDTNLLDPKNLKELEEGTYWEVGTSGCKLSYINIFDRNGIYLGDMDSAEFLKSRRRVNNAYTHYLMDYLRDEMKVPREGYEDLSERLISEYERMRTGYEEMYGMLPILYAMPMNDSEFGENSKVGDLAKRVIYDMFEINFNRRVYSFNNREANSHELTRCQPQPYWRTNHLLMRVWADSGEDVAFRVGDENLAGMWESTEGEAEFIKDTIAITSLPDGYGALKLKNSEELLDVRASVRLEGNKLGSQELLFRWTDEGYISARVKNGALVISEMKDGESEILYVYDIQLINGLPPHEISTPLSLLESGRWELEVSLEGNMLTVTTDGKTVAQNIEVSVLNPGSVGLRSQTSVIITDNRRPQDNIYDAIFAQLVVTDANGNMYYDGNLRGIQLWKATVDKAWKALINWFIENT